MGMLSPHLPVSNGSRAGTADGGFVAAAAAATAPSVPSQPGSATRPPPPRRMSFRVGHGAAALQALSPSGV
ncbi:hypothetical protein CHLRE_03g195326v5 [Chlamydomonas reinhardtii]|uniref:Uncharacterized protein n=1 Tax=Chlamydomonas reinhardtii TaxID=3055 RepID=A0A2K3DYK7_CHLRE|nr:uncharacterized protein CHLRE_03g195326v5 [Chlamydomonas reinhardtii]PNW85624.1 hypothetical protein CHLRE_03g195326v5 [Chlamydomonas reinhardtii]